MPDEPARSYDAGLARFIARGEESLMRNFGTAKALSPDDGTLDTSRSRHVSRWT